MKNDDSLFLLSSRYNKELNKAQLVFYDNNEQSNITFTDNSNFKPFCLTDLSPEHFYTHCITKQYDSIARKTQSSGHKYIRLLPAHKVRKFDTITGQHNFYSKI